MVGKSCKISRRSGGISKYHKKEKVAKRKNYCYYCKLFSGQHSVFEKGTVELVLESVYRVLPVWVITTNAGLSHEIEAGLSDIALLKFGGTFGTWQSAFAHIKDRQSQEGQILLADEIGNGRSAFNWVTIIKETVPTVSVIAVLDESDSEAIESALKVGVSGFLARTSPVSQIVSALMTTATGGIALSPSVMNKIIGIGAGRNLSNSSQNVTKREVDILRLLADGRSVKEIADKLSISYYTVDTHIRNLHRKLRVKNSSGLITVAMRRRLI